MIFLLLIFMFFLGVVQVVWALIHAIVTDHKQIRRHFGFYGIGVAFYFLIWWLLDSGKYDSFESPLFILHFFFGAAALCTYHIWIVSQSITMRREQNARMHQADWA